MGALPGLRPETLKVDILDDHSALTISGFCMPTARQAEQMRQQIVAQLERVSPQKFRQLRDNFDEDAAKAYAELGEGQFGRFSGSFTLPADVDTAGVRACYDDTTLRVILPRKVRYADPVAARRNDVFRGHPMFGW